MGRTREEYRISNKEFPMMKGKGKERGNIEYRTRNTECPAWPSPLGEQGISNDEVEIAALLRTSQ